MDGALKIGDVVQLKSGGPKMTVSSDPDNYSFQNYKSVKCVWFDGTKRSEELFPVDALELH